MIDKIKHIEVNGVEYPLAFSLNVMEDVQSEFGAMGQWAKKLSPEGKEETDIKTVIWTYEHFINEGIDIENETATVKRPFITHKQAGRIVTTLGFGEATNKIFEITSDSTSTGEEKN